MSQFIEMIGSKDWPQVKLKDIVHEDCPISYGIVQPGDDLEDGVPIVRPIDMNDTHLIDIKTLKHTSKQISDSYNRTILRGDEILVCVRGTTGLIALADGLKGCNVTRGITPLYFKPEYSREYLYRAFLGKQVQEYIQANTIGTTLKGINMGKLRELPICIPTKDIQERFVSIAEQADKSGFVGLKSQFIEMFEGNKYPHMSLEEISIEWLKGQPFKKDDIIVNGATPCIHYGELFTKYGPIINDVSSTTNISPKKTSKAGDILFPASDVTPNGLARCSMLSIDNVILGGDIIVLRPNNEYDPGYLSYAINQQTSQLLKRVNGGVVKHLSAKALKTVQIPIPPKDKQEEYISIAEQADKSGYGYGFKLAS